MMHNLTYDSATDQEWSPSKKRMFMAWTTHFFTATGAVWGLLAIVAITNQQWILAFAWMATAFFVDSFDGLLARKVRVKEVLPNFDGALLDNMLDFLNYVVVPAFFLYMAELFPPQMTLVGAGLILLASSYQFCQDDAKTDDHYFKGFPSYWNILVFYLFILNMSGWVNLAVVALLSVLVFVPIKFIYPSRMTSLQKLTMGLSLIWGAANIAILFQYPAHNPWLIWISLLFVIYYNGLSLYHTIR